MRQILFFCRILRKDYTKKDAAKESELSHPLLRQPAFTSHFLDRVLGTKNERNAPDTRERYRGIDDPGKQCACTTADPRHGIELKKPDPAPVQCADHDKDQCNTVNDGHDFYLFSKNNSTCSF